VVKSLKVAMHHGGDLGAVLVEVQQVLEGLDVGAQATWQQGNRTEALVTDD
jgi:hypothetical protein